MFCDRRLWLGWQVLLSKIKQGFKTHLLSKVVSKHCLQTHVALMQPISEEEILTIGSPIWQSKVEEQWFGCEKENGIKIDKLVSKNSSKIICWGIRTNQDNPFCTL